MMIHREHLLQLLSSDYTIAQVAEKIGVETEELVLALQDDVDLVKDVARMKGHKVIDDLYDKIEELAAKRLAMAIAQENDPMKLLRVATGINAARRRSQGETFDTTSIKKASVVSLVLPSRVPIKRTENAQKEIVALGDKSLESLSSAKLMEMMDAKRISTDVDEFQKKILEARAAQDAEILAKLPVKAPTKSISLSTGKQSARKLSADEALAIISEKDRENKC